MGRTLEFAKKLHVPIPLEAVRRRQHISVYVRYGLFAFACYSVFETRRSMIHIPSDCRGLILRWNPEHQDYMLTNEMLYPGYHVRLMYARHLMKVSLKPHIYFSNPMYWPVSLNECGNSPHCKFACFRIRNSSQPANDEVLQLVHESGEDYNQSLLTHDFFYEQVLSELFHNSFLSMTRNFRMTFYRACAEYAHTGKESARMLLCNEMLLDIVQRKLSPKHLSVNECQMVSIVPVNDPVNEIGPEIRAYYACHDCEHCDEAKKQELLKKQQREEMFALRDAQSE